MERWKESIIDIAAYILTALEGLGDLAAKIKRWWKGLTG